MPNLQGDGEAQSLTTCLRARKLGSQQTFLPGDHRPLPHRDAMSIQCAEGNGDPGTQKAPNKCSAVFPITPRSQEIYALVSLLAVSLNGSLELMDSPHLAVEDLSFWDREGRYTARWQQSQDGQTDSLTPS